MSLLITCLDQHKIIIENFWLKRNQILINSANDQLISLLKIQTSKFAVLKASSQSAFHRFESNKICEIKWKNLNLIVTLTIILKWLTNQKLVNQFIESVQFIESLLLVKSSTQVDFDQSWLNWSRQVKYLSSSQVLDLKSIKLSWNFFEKVSSWIEKLNLRDQIKLKSLTQQLDSKIRFNSTRY